MNINTDQIIEKYLTKSKKKVNESETSVTAKNLKKGMMIWKFGKVDSIQKQNHIIIVKSGSKRKIYDETQSVTIQEASGAGTSYESMWLSWWSRPYLILVRDEMILHSNDPMYPTGSAMTTEDREKASMKGYTVVDW